jgi:hypothetical protein
MHDEVSRYARPLCIILAVQYLFFFIAESFWCEEGLVRLANGFSELEGRVELYQNGSWIRVCPFNQRTGDAICKRLGFSSKGAW